MNAREIIDFTNLDTDIQNLIKDGTEVRKFAYTPYSGFKVGAALLCNDGTVYKGCNIENSSFPVGVCAERTAIVKAVSEGKTKFKALAVIADLQNGTITTPCGMCRQAIAEFGDITLYLTRSDMKSVWRIKSSNLLPFSFVLENDK